MSAPHQSPTPYSPPSAAARAGSLAIRVLWTVIPFGTLGLAAWVPALHIARRRRTTKAWGWLAANVAGTVGECVLVATVPANGHGSAGDAGTGAGFYCVAFFIAATVYAWRGCGPGLPKPVRRPVAYGGYGAAWSQTLPYPNPNPNPNPNPMAATAPAFYPVNAPGPGPLSAPVAAPAVPLVPAAAAHDMAAQDMAAEIQAELRELRGFLGGEEAR
ncbi:hypothetical protein ABIA35_000128 [Catenulispora sp. MAP12-49]|uniref:hypothetical protein n=1 Tax=Catenulispora sp. MAP12-49 TaxID=3156302 RepID=UPI003519127A